MELPRQRLSSRVKNEELLRNKSVLNEHEVISYEIHRYSSFSSNYVPENIMVDNPSDQASRWSALSNVPPQFLILKLQRPAIVKRIKFGKFEKSHVCNIKKFRVLGGLDENNMVTLLESGLKNNNKPEVFNLRCITSDHSENLPVLYIKIVPLLSWGTTFSYSIWYIELHGQDDPMLTTRCMKNYNALREVEIIRMCLKHFRQQGYDEAYRALQEQTQVQLEQPVITRLHRILVKQGDFAKAEQFISRSVELGLTDEYLSQQDYRHSWHLQKTECSDKPGTRGGHQLVMDTKNRLIYLYGGWDGFRDLSDLWAFDIARNSWSLLFENTEKFNGPTPRSCHKMVYDPQSENLFMIGRYLDNSIRTREYIKSDFFMYDTRERTWLQICHDTSQVGGPQLVYDHQLCIDVQKRTIYMFGGKILTPLSVSVTNDSEYSGLFSYHIPTNTWTEIFVDCHHPSASEPDVLSIKSRITHCMLFHTHNRKLYIYGGQRGKDDIEEFITYDVDSKEIAVLNGGQTNSTTIEWRHEPSPGYTLRASIDCERDEIYVFSSLNKVKDRRDVPNIDTSNSFWVYSLQKNKWTRIYHHRHNLENKKEIEEELSTEPCPRFAHQMIYDEYDKIHYLFGGNPGRPSVPQLRLDDFWKLVLEKPKREEILRHCRFLLRKLCYLEMIRVDPIKAMQYLRNHVSLVINHDDKDQLEQFHKLATYLFSSDNDVSDTELATTPTFREGREEYDRESGNYEIRTVMSGSEQNAGAPPSPPNSCGSYNSSISTDMSEPSGSSGRDSLDEIISRRSFLFNKLVRLLPSNMVQPEHNLSDFVKL